jgi:endonuclease/exonuclease/phosphatase family metal-dependent hydrolase
MDNISNTFVEQEEQVQILKNSIKNSPHNVLLAGDFNNTAFSYIYRELSKGFNDSFKEKGNGFGITFNYNFIPLRIDFILAEKLFKINSFKTFKINLSDHEPIYSEITY